MDWSEIDWEALARLRKAFLEGSAGESDYWRNERDLASYDQTFAQRIGWKWEYVLKELDRRGWRPPRGVLLDWGCGSGIAGRIILDHFGTGVASQLSLWDRSPLALRYASRRAGERFSGVPIGVAEGTEGTGSPPEILLLSHVVTELDAKSMDQVLDLIRRATVVLWVEPGTFAASRRLSELRDTFLESFHVVAPCTHCLACPMFTPGNESHWCHHFASPPPSVFTDGNWARFATVAGIDLRSLPLSFLVLDKRPTPACPQHAVRIIGQPRVYKAHAQLLACGPDGLHERRLSKRTFPAEFRQVKKGQSDPLQVWECDQGEVVALRGW